MIDLRNTCVLVRTKEENEMLLKEAEKQEFHWYKKDHCEPLQTQYFPDILKFYEYDITYAASIRSDFAFYEASELLGTKEVTVREFIERIANTVHNCSESKCSECVLGETNTKCNRYLCNIHNWENNIDELLEILKSGKSIVCTPEEKIISILEKIIENPDRAALNDEFVESLKLAVEKLKEVK